MLKCIGSVFMAGGRGNMRRDEQVVEKSEVWDTRSVSVKQEVHF